MFDKKSKLILAVFLIFGFYSSFSQYYISGSTNVDQGSSYTYNINPSSNVQYTSWSAVKGSVSGTGMTSKTIFWTTSGSGSITVTGVDFLYNSINASLSVTIAATVGPPSTPPAPTVQSSSCGQVVLVRASPPSGVTYYWQSLENGTTTSNSSKIGRAHV